MVAMSAMVALAMVIVLIILIITIAMSGLAVALVVLVVVTALVTRHLACCCQLPGTELVLVRRDVLNTWVDIRAALLQHWLQKWRCIEWRVNKQQ